MKKFILRITIYVALQLPTLVPTLCDTSCMFESGFEISSTDFTNRPIFLSNCPEIKNNFTFSNVQKPPTYLWLAQCLDSMKIVGNEKSHQNLSTKCQTVDVFC